MPPLVFPLHNCFVACGETKTTEYWEFVWINATEYWKLKQRLWLWPLNPYYMSYKVEILRGRAFLTLPLPDLSRRFLPYLNLLCASVFPSSFLYLSRICICFLLSVVASLLVVKPSLDDVSESANLLLQTSNFTGGVIGGPPNGKVFDNLGRDLSTVAGTFGKSSIAIGLFQTTTERAVETAHHQAVKASRRVPAFATWSVAG